MRAGEQLLEHLNKLRGSATVIVCIGNSLKGDDGAGPALYQRLAPIAIGAELLDAGTVPENYIQPIIKKSPQYLLIVDAVDFGGSAGEIKLFEPIRLDSLAISTHTLSPELFVDVLRRSIEVEVYFIGIQPAGTVLGQPLSQPVADAVSRLAQLLAEIFPPTK
jgi:hydrogenase 3 maturation protease